MKCSLYGAGADNLVRFNGAAAAYCEVPVEALNADTPKKTDELRRIIYEKERYRVLFEMGPVAVYSCDTTGVIDNFNARAAELWGRTPEPGDTDERFCGSHRLFLPDGTHLPHHECPMAQVLRGELIEVRDQEVLIERPDGSRLTVLVNIGPLRSAEGKLTGAINCFYDITDRKRLEESLREGRDHLEATVERRTLALRELSSRLMTAQDDERRRISRELHDGLGQYLVHLKMGLQTLRRASKPDQQETLNDLIDVAEKCCSETRTLSYLLHPPLLEELGLASAINWYVDGFIQRSGIQVSLYIAPESKWRLPNSVEILLFRVLQESLTNIHRHSNSPSADIRLELAREKAVLQVTDYGQGFSAELLEDVRSGLASGVGLRGMRERVGEAGGCLEIESDSKGTLVRAIVPLTLGTVA
jgi:PAS domain S-box-containing protein